MAAKITLRDGKQFITVAGREIEIESPESAAQQVNSAEGQSVREYCTQRFAKDPAMRRAMKGNLERYIAVETKCRNDESRRSTREEREAELDGGNPDDPVTNILQNRNVCYRVN